MQPNALESPKKIILSPEIFKTMEQKIEVLRNQILGPFSGTKISSVYVLVEQKRVHFLASELGPTVSAEMKGGIVSFVCDAEGQTAAL